MMASKKQDNAKKVFVAVSVAMEALQSIAAEHMTMKELQKAMAKSTVSSVETVLLDTDIARTALKKIRKLVK